MFSSQGLVSKRLTAPNSFPSQKLQHHKGEKIWKIGTMLAHKTPQKKEASKNTVPPKLEARNL